VDGLGSGAWDAMLRRTDLVLSKPDAFEGRIPASKPEELDDSMRGKANGVPSDDEFYADTAVTTFLVLLQQRFPDAKINLVGHSMGAIVANSILARHPRLPIQNVVYMGAAARIKDVESVLVPWMRHQGHEQARFYNLSLDPYREISENEFYDFIPRGSLLHWIDNIFGEVNSFKDRTSGSWWNIARTAADVFPRDGQDGRDLRKRVFLTRFPIGDATKGPQEHGEFDDFCFWQRDFWLARQPLKNFPECLKAQRVDTALKE
jgi:pimeloyl-ACP methyl ester carboxylesterase